MTASLLEIGGVAARAIAASFGTPCYVYDLDAIVARYRELRDALPSRVEVFYAVKANPSRAILHRLAAAGAGADVASEGELMAALDARIPPRRIVCTGPAKSDAFLDGAVAAGVAAIHAEGPHEVARIAAMAVRRRRTQIVSLRLNPGWGIAERRRIIGGAGAHKFGMDLPTARRVLAAWKGRRGIRIAGFQVFNASNVLDASLLAANARRVTALAARLAREHGMSLSLVDLGGGLGIPYGDGEAPLSITALGRGLARIGPILSGHPGARVVLEPGRFLVGPAGTYLTRVVEVKRTRGTRHVLVDGGVHHLLRPALIGTPHRITAAEPRPGRVSPACVSGPLCTSLDVLHASAPLPPVEPGDLLAVHDTGAYGFTESMPLFLSHPWPAEVGVASGRAHLLRPPPPSGAQLRVQRVR